YHLVPFGEFIPWGFRWFVDLMQMPLGDFTAGARIQKPIPVADQLIGINICFEDLFGEEIIRALSPKQVAAAQPTILLNVSNLAWFGNTIALRQHLDIARMRSLETGRPTIRSTNTGMTAYIDHKGRVLAASPAMHQDILLAKVQGAQGTTPFSYIGNTGALLISIFVVLICLIRTAGLMRSGRTIGGLS
ncbi:MAG: apolipoprotein N-acyltransferase, partial [Pseudomonadota bacterium]